MKLKYSRYKYYIRRGESESIGFPFRVRIKKDTISVFEKLKRLSDFVGILVRINLSLLAFIYFMRLEHRIYIEKISINEPTCIYMQQMCDNINHYFGANIVDINKSLGALYWFAVMGAAVCSFFILFAFSTLLFKFLFNLAMDKFARRLFLSRQRYRRLMRIRISNQYHSYRTDTFKFVTVQLLYFYRLVNLIASVAFMFFLLLFGIAMISYSVVDFTKNIAIDVQINKQN